MSIGVLWNKLADPKNIPRLFAFSLGIILIVGLIVPMALNPDQLYPRPAPQEQIDEGLAIAPYDRGGEVLVSPGEIDPQYPDNAASLGMITGYMSPLAQWISSISPYFGTSIYSSPGGLIDEVDEAFFLELDKDNGGSQIAKVIIEECTDLSFFVGKTINAAHQNPGLPFDLSIRMNIVAQMVEIAKQLGKHVTIQYY